uniref:Tyrosine-protein phosphatase domain-containing protein n=1 Tax=Macrostomum lignano TaxID=282301 RepID=A0A1I8F6X6_9PLAT
FLLAGLLQPGRFGPSAAAWVWRRLLPTVPGRRPSGIPHWQGCQPKRWAAGAESGTSRLIIVLGRRTALGLTAVVCISVAAIGAAAALSAQRLSPPYQSARCYSRKRVISHQLSSAKHRLVCSSEKGTERGRNFRNGSGGHSNNRQPMQVLVEPSLKQPLIPASQQNSTSFCATAATGGTLQSVVGSATLQRQQQQQQQQQQQFGTLQSSSHVGTLPTLSIRSASSSAAFHQGPTDPVELRRINFQTPDVNKPKNRYANVIAYDHSRVVLQPLDGLPGSDYINAKLHGRLTGGRMPYIATQGPCQTLSGDFWRMIWGAEDQHCGDDDPLEERSRVKCDMYWPNKGSEVLFDYMTARPAEKREIHHFHVQRATGRTNGVARAACAPLPHVRPPGARLNTNPTPGPIVAHCSAPVPFVGRTGAFRSVIDAMPRTMKQEKERWTLYGHVTCLRAQRNTSMVPD